MEHCPAGVERRPRQQRPDDGGQQVTDEHLRRTGAQRVRCFDVGRVALLQDDAAHEAGVVRDAGHCPPPTASVARPGPSSGDDRAVPARAPGTPAAGRSRRHRSAPAGREITGRSAPARPPGGAQALPHAARRRASPVRRTAGASAGRARRSRCPSGCAGPGGAVGAPRSTAAGPRARSRGASTAPRRASARTRVRPAQPVAPPGAGPARCAGLEGARRAHTSCSTAASLIASRSVGPASRLRGRPPGSSARRCAAITSATPCTTGRSRYRMASTSSRPDARPAEKGLGDDGAAQQEAELQPDDREQRRGDVAQRVAEDGLAPGQPLGAVPR